MKIAIACDHGGYNYKDAIAEHVCELGHEVEDFGPFSEDRVDYPDYAVPVANAVASGEADFGILICGTGLGMSLAANKVKGIRAICAQTDDFARLAREHNNANILCLSGRFVTLEQNKHLVDIFLSTEFLGGRHAERVAKIMALEG